MLNNNINEEIETLLNEFDYLSQQQHMPSTPTCKDFEKKSKFRK